MTEAPMGTPGGTASTRSRLRDPAFVVVVIGVAAIGAWAGREMAFQRGAGGMGAAFGPPLIVAGLLVGMLVVAAIWSIVARLCGREARRTRGSIAVAIGLLWAGAISGYAISAGPAGIRPEPVILEATGRMSTILTGGSPQFVAHDAAATCYSHADSRDLGSIESDDVAEFGAATLRPWVHPGVAGADPVVDLVVESTDLPEGADHVGWTGPAQLVESNDGRTQGRVSFEHLPREAVKQPTATPSSDWPDTLSGAISWVCDPW